MSAPNPAPLAALLASHPEEVVAMLATRMNQQGATLADIREALMNLDPTCQREALESIINAGIMADLIKINLWRECRIEAGDRYAIARHPRGVMGWLRARLSLAPLLAPGTEDRGLSDPRGCAARSRIRLYEWAIDAAERGVGWAEATVMGELEPQNEAAYRVILEHLVEGG